MNWLPRHYVKFLLFLKQMCLLKRSSLSMISPSNYTSLDSLNTKVLVKRFWGWYDFSLSIVNWNFSELVFMELILNQNKGVLASCSRFSNTVFKFALQGCKDVIMSKIANIRLLYDRKSRLWIHWIIRVPVWTLAELLISVQFPQDEKIFICCSQEVR